MSTGNQPSNPPRMYRRSYKLRKSTPKLPAGIKILTQQKCPQCGYWVIWTKRTAVTR